MSLTELFLSITKKINEDIYRICYGVWIWQKAYGYFLRTDSFLNYNLLKVCKFVSLTFGNDQMQLLSGEGAGFPIQGSLVQNH